jgi:FAD/FMN-containing dehydrogenase
MLTDDPEATMLNLDRLSAMLAPPTTERPVVRVQAGMRLHTLNKMLHPLGFAMENLGAIAEQSVAGATQTSTHGTGRKLGSLSTALVSLTLVLSNASVLMVNATLHPEIFAAASVGLGALGVVVEAEIRVVPSFKLRRTEMPWDLDELVAALPSLNERYERLQWYWTPFTTSATLLLREAVPSSTPVDTCWPTGENVRASSSRTEPSGGGNVTCLDWSFKALCHPSAYDEQRALYTEMEVCDPSGAPRPLPLCPQPKRRRFARPARSTLCPSTRPRAWYARCVPSTRASAPRSSGCARRQTAPSSRACAMSRRTSIGCR